MDTRSDQDRASALPPALKHASFLKETTNLGGLNITMKPCKGLGTWLDVYLHEFQHLAQSAVHDHRRGLRMPITKMPKKYEHVWTILGLVAHAAKKICSPTVCSSHPYIYDKRYSAQGLFATKEYRKSGGEIHISLNKLKS